MLHVRAEKLKGIYIPPRIAFMNMAAVVTPGDMPFDTSLTYFQAVLAFMTYCVYIRTIFGEYSFAVNCYSN